MVDISKFFLDRNAIVTFGDSRPAQAFVDASTHLVRSGSNYITMGLQLMGQRLKIAAGLAVSGQRSDQYMSAANQAAALATNAYWLLVQGIVNDISLNGNSVDYFNVYIKPFLLVWIAQGRGVILPTETFLPGFSGSAANLGAVAKYNRQVRQFCRENPNAVLFDVAAVVMNPTTAAAFKSNYSGDGTHINLMQGAIALGQAFATLMSTLVPPCSGLITSVNDIQANGNLQLFSNPLFTTTSGGTGGAGVTGTVPGGVTGIFGPSGFTAAVSTTAGPFGNDFVIAWTTTQAGTCQVQFDMTPSPLEQTGDQLYGTCEVVLASGSSNFQCSALHLESNRGGTTTYVEDGYVTSANGAGPVTARTVDHETEIFTVGSGSRGWLTGYLNLYCSGAASFTTNLRQLAFWKRVP